LQADACYGADMATMSNGAQDVTVGKTFDDVFRVELADISERHNRTSRPKFPDKPAKSMPTTALGLTGLACSDGGIRSAAFCLGVLQDVRAISLRAVDHGPVLARHRTNSFIQQESDLTQGAASILRMRA
jgi:hypothetical protein